MNTSLSQEQVAEVFRAVGWEIRKWSWTNYELRCSWAELYLDGEGEILLHGPVAEPQVHAEELFALLRQAGVVFRGEFYGPDTGLLQEFSG